MIKCMYIYMVNYEPVFTAVDLDIKQLFTALLFKVNDSFYKS